MKQIQHILLFLSASSVVLTFPVQVVFHSKYGALLPYIFLFSASCLKLIFLKRGTQIKINIKMLSYLIGIYCLLVFINGYFQLIFNLINIEDYLASIINFVFPALFYYYFSLSITTIKDRNSFLIGIVTAGILSTCVYLWDTYYMTLKGEISYYSKAYFEYSAYRVNNIYDISLNNWKQTDLNPSRLLPTYRSQGFLQSAAVSSAIVAITAFILLCYKIHNKKTFSIILITFFTILLIVQNMTALIGYLLTIIIISVCVNILNYKNKYMNIIYLIVCFLISFAVLLLSSILLIPKFNTYIFNQLNAQFNVLFNYTPESSYIFGWISILSEIADRYASYYPALILGDGFATFAIVSKGGDYGFLESFVRFGIVVTPILFIILSKYSIKGMKLHKNIYKYTNNHLILFPSMLIIYFLISELHYTTWSTKATLPIIFFSFTLYRLKWAPNRVQ